MGKPQRFQLVSSLHGEVHIHDTKENKRLVMDSAKRREYFPPTRQVISDTKAYLKNIMDVLNAKEEQKNQIEDAIIVSE